MAGVVSTIAEMVPQLFYDIIARFVPGTIVILSWAVVAKGPTQDGLSELLKAPDSASGWSVLLFLLVAYVVSVVLHGVWKLIRKIWKRIRKTWKRIRTRSRRSSGSKKKSAQEPSEALAEKESAQEPSEALMYDAIRVKAPAVGARIVKLGAEVSLAQVLIVGWGIAGLLNLFLLIQDYSGERILLEVTLVVGIVGAYLFRQRIRQSLVISLKNHWRILQLDQEPWFAPPSNDQTPPESWLARLGDRLK